MILDPVINTGTPFSLGKFMTHLTLAVWVQFSRYVKCNYKVAELGTGGSHEIEV